MNIENINQILSFLEEGKDAVEIDIMDRSRKDENRFICFAKLKDGEKIVVKFYQNSYNTITQVAGWAKLACLYKDKSINVPLFRKFKNGEFAIHKIIENKKFLVWVEDYVIDKVPNEDVKMNNMDTDFYKDIGLCLGEMHSIAKNNNLNFNWNSPWVIFDTFCKEDVYDENYTNVLDLYNNLKNEPIDKERLDRIWNNYIEKRNLIEIGYERLPSGAVQGDLSINNIIMDEQYKFNGILDFNIAGNDVFVNHFMQEGIFLSYLSDEFWNSSSEIDNMNIQFRNFFNGYCEKYKMSISEKEKVKLLYQIIRPFRMEKVYPTISLISKKKFEEIDSRLKWIESEMEYDFENLNISVF